MWYFEVLAVGQGKQADFNPYFGQFSCLEFDLIIYYL